MRKTPRNVWIIVNPISGSGKGVPRSEAVADRLKAEGCTVERHVTRAAGGALGLAGKAIDDGADVVLVCGGDGTINEATQALAGTDTALAVMPLGTANIIGHELALASTVDSVTEVVLNGHARRLDVGLCGSRRFLCVAGVGFDAFVTKHMAEWRTGAISYLSYVKPIWKALTLFPFEPLRVTIDGEELPGPLYNVIIGNARYYGGPFMMTPRARPDDGLLDVLALGGRGFAWLLTYMISSTIRLHTRLPGVVYRRGTEIEVEAARPVPVQLDGDFRCHTPVRLGIEQRAITVLSNR